MILVQVGGATCDIGTILLNGAHLSFVTCYKYLGIICLNSFMDDNDITRQMW